MPFQVAKITCCVVIVCSFAYILLPYTFGFTELHLKGSSDAEKMVLKSRFGDSHSKLAGHFETNSVVQWNNKEFFSSVTDLESVILIEKEVEQSTADMIPRTQCTSDIVLVIVITSAVDNQERRQAIRNTWCSKQDKFSQLYQDQFQCFFMVGRPSDHNLWQALGDESLLYHDLITASYVDTYRNLTYKVLSGFQWVATQCREVQYIFKTDDDCFVNVAILLSLIQSNTVDIENVYIGKLLSGDDQTAVIRNKYSKWRVSRTEYQSDNYPSYISGIGYLLSNYTMIQILRQSKYVHPFPNEDAYVGVLAHQLGISPLLSGRFTFYNTLWRLCNFHYFVLLHHVQHDIQELVYNYTKTYSSECDSKRNIPRWN